MIQSIQNALYQGEQLFKALVYLERHSDYLTLLIQMQKDPFCCLTYKFPLDQQGFTQSYSIDSFDPAAVSQFFNTFGFVIFDGVLNEKQIELSVNDLWEDVTEMTMGEAKRDDPSTWEWIGPLGRYGFINDQPLSRPQLWKNRSHPNTYKAFKRLFQISSGQELKEPLLCLFDRGSILRPSKNNPDWKTGSIHHFDIHPWWWCGVDADPNNSWRDQNYYDDYFSKWLGEGNYVPKVRNFTKLQGVLALSDTHPGTGGFQCVGGFQNCMKEWCLKYKAGTRITRSPELIENMQECYQRKGSLLIFSRELPHNIFPNESENFRYAQYLRMAPESSLMLTEEEKMVRKRQVKKMLPPYYDVKNEICREIYMLEEEQQEKEHQNQRQQEKQKSRWMKYEMM